MGFDISSVAERYASPAGWGIAASQEKGNDCRTLKHLKKAAL